MPGCESSARTSSESRTVAEADRSAGGGARYSSVRVVTETPHPVNGLTLFENADWQARFPGLACGVTGSAEGHDFGISGNPSTGAFHESYHLLADRLGCYRVTVARQVHGKEVTRVRPGGASGSPDRKKVCVAGTADGLVAAGTHSLLAITVADCIPVYLVHAGSGALGLLHAGWRGAAAGILEAGLSRLESESGASAAAMHVHLGPGICGSCYEVGAEVLAAFGCPPGSRTVDLRDQLAARARNRGVREDSLTVSTWCTRCRSDQFHSHRGSSGTAGRMAAYLGWLEEQPGKGDQGV